MAFITKYNLGQLSQKLEVNSDITLQMFLDNIYDDPEIFSILNKRELEYLFIYKMLLDNEQKFIVEFYKEVPEKEDTKNLVFNKGGKMKYHLNGSCKLLGKDYLDFNIPQDIKDKGDSAVEEYRDWFRQNNFAERYKAGEIDKNYIIRAFNLKYPKKYEIKPIADDSNLLVLEGKNSNSEILDKDFDFAAFKQEINHFRDLWHLNFQCPVSRKFAKFKHLIKKPDYQINDTMSKIFSQDFVKNYGLERLKEKWKLSKELTNKIIELLLVYIKWAFKLSNKEFDVITLENLGLECCSLCKDETSKN